MDCSLPGSSIHGIFQARVLKWAAIAFSISSDRYIYFQSCNKKALSAHLHWCQPPICPWIFAQVSTPRSCPALQAEVCSAGVSAALFSAPRPCPLLCGDLCVLLSALWTCPLLWRLMCASLVTLGLPSGPRRFVCSSLSILGSPSALQGSLLLSSPWVLPLQNDVCVCFLHLPQLVIWSGTKSLSCLLPERWNFLCISPSRFRFCLVLCDSGPPPLFLSMRELPSEGKDFLPPSLRKLGFWSSLSLLFLFTSLCFVLRHPREFSLPRWRVGIFRGFPIGVPYLYEFLMYLWEGWRSPQLTPVIFFHLKSFYLCSLQFISWISYSFKCTGLLYPWLNLSLSITSILILLWIGWFSLFFQNFYY